MANFVVIGLMSGTSLDGLDITAVEFDRHEIDRFQIINSKTAIYPEKLWQQLNNATALNGLSLAKLDAELGQWFGEQVHLFCKEYKLQPDLIASHGHTIFHQPDHQFSTQIGMPWQIEKYNNCPVVADFRNSDLVRNGQGAPLVPGGEFQLFPDVDVFVNLGGFSNISFKKDDGEIRAFDISPCNVLLNSLIAELDLPFDKDGKYAKSGNVITSLLETANQLGYYQKNAPKSLGKEWFEQNCAPLFQNTTFELSDRLRTAVEHIVDQIEKIAVSQSLTGKRFMWTGGGARNRFLMQLIQSRIQGQHSKVSDEIIDYKEALIFAYLGLKRVFNQKNIFNSVTGASANSIGGALYGDFSKI